MAKTRADLLLVSRGLFDSRSRAQEAIAAQPKPVHVPRERPAPVVLDEGPLVLVETRRDLRTMTLPFEQAAS